MWGFLIFYMLFNESSTNTVLILLYLFPCYSFFKLLLSVREINFVKVRES